MMAEETPRSIIESWQEQDPIESYYLGFAELRRRLLQERRQADEDGDRATSTG
jgi:hypothetical protein